MASEHFTKDHEWVRVDGDIGTVGITKHAAEKLGDVVFVEVPAVGTKLESGKAAGVVESVKAASDVFAPVSGEVIAANDDLAGAPATVNEDAEGRGWFFKVRLANPGELAGLMDRAAYDAFAAADA
jgi:glycine cleavage system H protein